MFSTKRCNKRIHKIHEKSFRLILNDYSSSFDSLLSILNEKMIHQRCVRAILKKWRHFRVSIFEIWLKSKLPIKNRDVSDRNRDVPYI